MSNYLCIILQLKYITRRIDVMQRSYKVLLSMPTTSNLSNYVYIYNIYTGFDCLNTRVTTRRQFTFYH